MKGLIMASVMIILVLITAHGTFAADNKGPPAKDGFVSTFFDDFLLKAGGTPLPSSADWLTDLGTSYPGGSPGWGNSESQTYTSTASNLAVTQNHTLTITPQVSSARAWTSARIETSRSDFACAKGGRLFIEAKIKLGDAAEAQQQGIWPAFWAVGSSFRGNYMNWPMVGELDFLESVNGLPKMYSTVHCGTAPGGPCNEYTGIGSSVAFTKGQWHVVGFAINRNASKTWKEETMSWYLDGKVVFSVSGATVNSEDAWEQLAHQDKFLILNVAVGGSFPNAVSASGSTPTRATVGGSSVRMEVDYVGVWNSL